MTMVEDWELKSVERRIDSLEKSLDRDRERARKEKEEARDERWNRSEKRSDRIVSILYMLYGAALVAMVLALAGFFDRH